MMNMLKQPCNNAANSHPVILNGVQRLEDVFAGRADQQNHSLICGSAITNFPSLYTGTTLAVSAVRQYCISFCKP